MSESAACHSLFYSRFRRRKGGWIRLLAIVVLAGNGLAPLFLRPVAARAATPAGTTITNTATGSFADPDALGTKIEVTSNEVTVRISEVAGITIAASGVSDDGAVNPGDTIFYDFTITNVGNEDTLFFLPDAPSSVTNGSYDLSSDPIQLIEFTDGSGGTVDLTPANSEISAPITIPSGGSTTDTLLAGLTGITNGLIPADGTVLLRVPVTVDAGVSNGDIVTVIMGDTTDSGSGTQNQPDNADGATTNEVRTVDPTAGDTDDDPVNGEREASISQVSGAIVTGDANPDLSQNFCQATSPTLLFILDDSSSVDNTEVAQQRAAVMSTLNDLVSKNIPARAAIVGFDSRQLLVIDYTDVTTATLSDFQMALDANYGVDGSGTNWEAGFQAGVALGVSEPDVVFFFTDGVSTSGGSPDDEAALFKAGGAHIYGIGIGGLTIEDGFRGITDGANAVSFDQTNLASADFVAITDYTFLQSQFTDAFVSTLCASPNILLVKRITAINGLTTNPNDDTTQLDQVVDDTLSAYQNDDDAAGWPTDYLKGELNAGPVKPGDTIEYTIYFLNSGGTVAEEVRICDRIESGQAFQLGAYGAGTSDIQLHLGDLTTGSTYDLTAANDAGDRAQFVTAGTIPSNCNLQGANDIGTLMLDITGTIGTAPLPHLPNSTGQGTPNNSYGFFRFTTKVDE